VRTYHSPKDYLDEAQSPDTSWERLDILSEAQWEFVRAAVAANPHTSVRTLVGLLPPGTRPLDEQIALAIAKREDAPPEALRQLVVRFGHVVNWSGRNLNFELGLALAANPATPPDAIAVLLDPKKTTAHFRTRLAASSRRLDVLHRLQSDVSEKVRRRAENALEGMKTDY
jgi:hypothetical protein